MIIFKCLLLENNFQKQQKRQICHTEKYAIRSRYEQGSLSLPGHYLKSDEYHVFLGLIRDSAEYLLLISLRIISIKFPLVYLLS